MTPDSISSCAGSSSRTHGVKADFGATSSTVFADAIATMLSHGKPSAIPPPSPKFMLRISLLLLRIHKFLETIEVIALRGKKLASDLGFSRGFKQTLVQYSVRTPAFAPLRSSPAP
jgi:hypothetical protein